MDKKTYAFIFSNSSRFLWRLKKAAARFFTMRTSRFDMPHDALNMVSLLAMRFSEPSHLLDTSSGLSERLAESHGDIGNGGSELSRESDISCVETHACSNSDSGVKCIWGILDIEVDE